MNILFSLFYKMRYYGYSSYKVISLRKRLIRPVSSKRIHSNGLCFIALSIFSFTHCAVAQTAQADAVCPAGIPETAGDADFLSIPAGEILHVASNLIFMRCSIGQTWDGSTCTNEPTSYNWQEALQLSQETSFNSSNNWRLPNIKELSVITERACVRPSINDTLFPNTSPDDYWTSTPSMLDENSSWAVSFANASNALKLKNRSLFVRLVRTRLPSETIAP